MDNNSLGVLSTLGIDILVAIILGLVWVGCRKCRGDKRSIRATQIQADLTNTNNLFHDNEESIDLHNNNNK